MVTRRRQVIVSVMGLLYIVALIAMSMVEPGPFWPGYYGNLMATLIGVALGIPLGLWVNRWLLELQTNQEREAQWKHLNRVLGQVLNAVELNQGRARQWKEGKQFYEQMDVQTWWALAPTVLGELASFGEDEEELATLLSTLFTAIEGIQKLIDHRLALRRGASLLRTEYEAEVTRTEADIKRTMEVLDSVSEELLPLLHAVRRKLA